MNVREWIVAEHAALLTRFEQSVAGEVPLDLWKERVGAGGSSIAWLIFHTSLHEDLAVNAVLGGGAPVLASAHDALGLAGVATAAGLGETELREVTDAIDLDALRSYMNEVHTATQTWLAAAADDTFERLLDLAAEGREGLTRAGVGEADVPWLYRMWTDKRVSFFLQWEAVGHRINHVGEMVSVRNRLGLSPFSA